MRERKRGRVKRQTEGQRERETEGERKRERKERDTYVNSWAETRMDIRRFTVVPTGKGK